MDKRGHKWTAVDTLFWLGGLFLSLAAGMAALPLGLAAAGGFCLAGAYLVDRSGEGDGR